MKTETQREEISVDLLRELVTYDPVSGVLRWLPRRPEHYEGRALSRTKENLANNFNARFPGRPVGSAMKGGYLSTRILGTCYLCHRIAYAIVTGQWPKNEIDHINGITDDNSWRNLRAVDHLENGKNQRRRTGPKASGVIGVDFHQKSQKWRARITNRGVVETIGFYRTLERASLARKAAERRYGFHPNHGRAAA